MGASCSAHQLLSSPEVVDWKVYTKAEWRSTRVKELDELGGLGRPTIARGKSFQSRLDFLGMQVLGQADEIHELFEKYKQGKFHDLHQRGEGEVVAQWRVKVHAARKRVILVVWGMIRFKSTIKMRSRLRRVDTWGYMIPSLLGPDTTKFVVEQIKCISARAELAAAEAADAAEAAEAEAVAAAAAAVADAAAADMGQLPQGSRAAALAVPDSPMVSSPGLAPLAVTSGATVWTGPEGPLLERCSSPPEHTEGGLTPTPPLLPPPSRGLGLMAGNSTSGAALRPWNRQSLGGQEAMSGGAGGNTASPSVSGGQASANALASEGSDSEKLPLNGTPRLGRVSNSGAGPLPGSGGGASDVLSMPRIPFSRSTQRRQELLGRTSRSRWSMSGAAEAAEQGSAPGSPSELRTPSDGGLSTTMRNARASRWSTAGTTSDSEQMGPAAGKSRFNKPNSLSGGAVGGLPSPKPSDRPQWNGLHHMARVWQPAKPLSSVSAEGLPTSGKDKGILSSTGRLKLPQLGPGLMALNGASGAVDTQGGSRDSTSRGETLRTRLLHTSLDGGLLGRSRRTSMPSDLSGADSPPLARAEDGEDGGADGSIWPAGSRFLAHLSSAGSGAPGGGSGGTRGPGKSSDVSVNSSVDELSPGGNGSAPMYANITQRLRTSIVRIQDAGLVSEPGSPSGSDVRAFRRQLTRSESCREDMSSADKMLQMFLNRSNTSWTSQQQWQVPNVVTTSAQTAWDSGTACRNDYASILRMVKKGKVAFWFIVGEDSLPAASKASSSGTASLSPQLHDIWTSDPYDLISGCRPGLLHDQEDKIIRGYSYQSRALGQLALSIVEAGGKEALAGTHIVLSINDDQQEDVTRELWDHKFYGFDRRRVIIIAQQKRPGYRYDAVAQRFIPATDLTTSWESNGTGLAAMQMNWCPDAFTLNADGLVEGIFGTTAEMLSQRGVEWMMCHRARDLITMEGCLDFKLLALGEWQRNEQGATMLTQVLLSEKMSSARALDSLVLCRARGGNTELRTSTELSSHALDQAVERAKSMFGNKVAVGIQRYLFSVPHLRTHLVSNKDFRPKLKLRDGLLFVKYDISDISSTPGACLAAVEVPERPPLLMSDKDLDQLLAAAQQQDRKHKLLNHLDTLRPKITLQAMVPSVTPKAQMPGSSGNVTVVFIEKGILSLPAVRMAVTVSRPGRDIVNLCTFVAEAGHADSARIALHQILERIGKSPVAINVDVLVRSGHSLLEAMQAYVTLWKADLVVVPSACLARTEPQALLGSVALAILKRMECPVLMLSSKAAPAANTMYDKNALRMLMVVEGWTKPLLEYSCSRILQPRKGDKLILAQVHTSRIATTQQMNNLRHYMAGARSYIESKQMDMSMPPLLLDGSYVQEVDKAVRDYRINILAVQQPPGTKAVQKNLISLLTSSVAGILVMKTKR